MRFHGVLLDLDGTGVLLAGRSGAGKSECALELVARGHRLIADDAVDLRREGERLVGRAPDEIRGMLEIRGLGILLVTDLYGPGAVAEECAVDLVCRFEPQTVDPDRTGLQRERETLLDVAVSRVVIPTQPGASLATIVDAAARDHRCRALGPSAAERLDARLRARAKAL